MPGHSITDNTLIAQELTLDLDKRLWDPNLMLKIDMEKGYDRVEWTFLIFMLHRFGLHEWNMDLLFHTLTNTGFYVLVNREPTYFFKSSRGVHQGNPLPDIIFAGF